MFASNSHSQTRRSPERSSLSSSRSQTHRSHESSSLSRSQSSEFWSLVHTPVCHLHTLFISVLCTASLWGIVCFVTSTSRSSGHFRISIIVFGHPHEQCLFAYSLPVLLPFWSPCVWPSASPWTQLPASSCGPLLINTCCALRLKPELCLPSYSLHSDLPGWLLVLLAEPHLQRLGVSAIGFTAPILATNKLPSPHILYSA